MLMDGSYKVRFLHHPRIVRQYAISALSVNVLKDKADITHWRIDGQSGDDGGSFLSMIRPSTWQRPYMDPTFSGI